MSTKKMYVPGKMPIKTEVVPVEGEEPKKAEKVPKAQAKRRATKPPEAPPEAPPVPEVLPEAAEKKPKSKAKSKTAPKKKKDLFQKADCTICNSETTHEDLLMKHKCSKSALDEKRSPSLRYPRRHRLSGRTRTG